MEIRKTRVRQLIFDFCLCLLVGLPYLAVWLTVSPFERGFFCNDDSIKYPYHEDTVSMGQCAGVGIAASVISFVLVEFGLSFGEIKSGYKRIIWECGKVAIAYFVGAGLAMITIEVGKLTVGRPRPHFIHVCEPDFSQIDCSQGYIYNFTCLNTHGFPQKTLDESRKSFPSGHSGFSAYTAFFLSVYFYQRLQFGFSYLLSITLQLFVTVGAVYIMLSRISDYKHHWSDVLVGGLVGFFVGVWTVLCLGKHLGFFHRRPKAPACYDEDHNQVEIQKVMRSLPEHHEENEACAHNDGPNSSNYGATIA